MKRSCAAAAGALVLVMLSTGTAFPSEVDKVLRQFKKCVGSKGEAVSDRSAAAAYYSCRRPVMECLFYLEEPKLWYEVSTSFREKVDEFLETPPRQGTSKYLCSPTVPAEIFDSLGTLTVEGSPADAPVAVDGIFVGRLPLSGLVIPEGEYTVSVFVAGSTADKAVTVRAGETASISMNGESTGKALNISAEQPRPPLEWRRSLESDRVKNVWAFDDGLAALFAGSKTLRFFDGETGTVRWETFSPLAAAAEPINVGNSLYWTSRSGMLYRINLTTGETETLEKAGTAGECLLESDTHRVYTACRDGSAGAVKAFDIGSGEELWSAPSSGRSLVLHATENALLVLSELDGAVSGTALSLDPETGKNFWKRHVDRPDDAILAAENNLVFFWGGREGANPVFLDPLKEGEEVPLHVGSGAFPSEAKVSGGHLLLLTDDGRFYSYDPEERKVEWRRRLLGDMSRVSILGATRHGVTLLTDESKSAGREGEVQGFMVILSPRTGKTLFSREVRLSQKPLFLGEDRVVIPDQLTTAFVRDMERDCTSWQFRSTAPGMLRENFLLDVAGDRLYLSAQRQSRLFSFLPGDCPPPLSLPDLPVLEAPEPKAPEKKKEERAVAVNRSPAPEKNRKPARPSRKRTVSRRSSPSNSIRPATDDGYAPPPEPRAFPGPTDTLPPLAKISPEQMQGKVTDPDLLARIAARCAEQLYLWVVPETDGYTIMGYRTGPFTDVWEVKSPVVHNNFAGGRYNFLFTNRNGTKAGLGIQLFNPTFIDLPGGKKGVGFGIKTDKGFVSFWDSIGRVEIIDGGTDVSAVQVQLHLPYASKGVFKELSFEDLNGDGDPEAMVRYNPVGGDKPRDGQKVMFYIVSNGEVTFRTAGEKIVSTPKGLTRETAVFRFEDRDGDGIKEIVIDKFSAPCCAKDAWPEKISEKPEVFRLVNNRYTVTR